MKTPRLNENIKRLEQNVRQYEIENEYVERTKFDEFRIDKWRKELIEFKAIKEQLALFSVSKKHHEEALKIEYDKGYYKGTEVKGYPF